MQILCSAQCVKLTRSWNVLSKNLVKILKCLCTSSRTTEQFKMHRPSHYLKKKKTHWLLIRPRSFIILRDITKCIHTCMKEVCDGWCVDEIDRNIVCMPSIRHFKSADEIVKGFWMENGFKLQSHVFYGSTDFWVLVNYKLTQMCVCLFWLPGNRLNRRAVLSESVSVRHFLNST